VGSTDWRRSRHCGTSADCVEVAHREDGVLVRDSKDHGTGPVIRLATPEWEAFLLDVRIGLPSGTTPVTIETLPTGTDVHHAGTTLRFTPGEWTAFRSGVLDGEFDVAVLGAVAR
jgi:hypothetical protein